LLCMGACIAYDARPIPNWPEPLVSDLHYVDCGTLDRADPHAPTTHYERLVPTLESLLADEQRMQRLRAAAGAYFDEHAAPERVADYVVGTVRAEASRRRALATAGREP